MTWVNQMTSFKNAKLQGRKFRHKARGAQGRPESITFLYLSFIFSQIFKKFGRVDYEKKIPFGGVFDYLKSL